MCFFLQMALCMFMFVISMSTIMSLGITYFLNHALCIFLIYRKSIGAFMSRQALGIANVFSFWLYADAFFIAIF